jgi:hypothetical protein
MDPTAAVPDHLPPAHVVNTFVPRPAPTLALLPYAIFDTPVTAYDGTTNMPADRCVPT